MKRIRQLEEDEGKVAVRTRICLDLNKSERTLLSWFQKGAPSAEDTAKLAVACGFSEGEAWQIARECFPLEAKDTA